jgi:hypothetical protein
MGCMVAVLLWSLFSTLYYDHYFFSVSPSGLASKNENNFVFFIDLMKLELMIGKKRLIRKFVQGNSDLKFLWTTVDSRSKLTRTINGVNIFILKAMYIQLCKTSFENCLLC